MQNLAEYWQFLRRRGLRDTCRFAVSSILDVVFDVAYGTRTGGLVPATELAPHEPVAAEATCYRPTRGRPFRELLRILAPLPKGGFVDYGCGKGRVLLLAAEHGLTDLIGLEISESLSAMAEAHMRALKARRPAVAYRIVRGDAACFEPPAEACVFYFYNPFSERVMAECLARIAASLRTHPRSHLVIYHHNMAVPAPQFNEFQWVSTHDLSANLFHLYRYEPLPGRSLAGEIQ